MKIDRDKVDKELFKVQFLPFLSPNHWLVYRDDGSGRHGHFKSEEQARIVIKCIENGFIPQQGRVLDTIRRLLSQEEFSYFMNKNSTRYYSGLQEKEVARLLEGRVIINSGATAFKKGDVEFELLNGDTILLECKTKTDTVKQFSIKKNWIEEAERDAFRMDCNYSGLVINFDPHRQDNYIVMGVREFKDLVDTLFVDGKTEGGKLMAEEMASELLRGDVTPQENGEE